MKQPTPPHREATQRKWTEYYQAYEEWKRQKFAIVRGSKAGCVIPSGVPYFDNTTGGHK